jgi:hypothetical protein
LHCARHNQRVIIRSGRKRSERVFRQQLPAAAAEQRCFEERERCENFNSALSQLHNKTQGRIRIYTLQALSIIATIIVRKKHLRQIMFCSAMHVPRKQLK